MLLKDILRIQRMKKNLTQEDIANSLFVSVQDVSKWENGKAVPSIDNLISLSDMYNISIDQLVQGSPFFKKPLQVGRKFNWKKCLTFMVIWLFISLLFTGFGYQPLWIFVIVFLLGPFIVLPATVDDYWIITNNSIIAKNYSTNDLNKLIEIFTGNPQTTTIKYQQIKQIEILYINRKRTSPFDINPDQFYLNVNTSTANFKLDLNSASALNSTSNDFLPKFVSFLERKNVSIVDEKHIINCIIQGKSLFETLDSTYY